MSEELLYGNEFLTPEDLEDLSPAEAERFIRYYKKAVGEGEPTAETKPLAKPEKTESIETYQNTLVMVDSRYRNKRLYPAANDFKMDFQRKLKNVVAIKLVKSVLPNTAPVIKADGASQNNMIYWINQEDADLQFPVYSAAIRTGAYTAITIVTEMTNIMNYVKRRGGSGAYHSFNISIDLSTDICNFTSLVKSQLVINPFSTTIGSGLITVAQTAHGYTDGQVIYFSGAQTFAGIDEATLNDDFPIAYIDANTYSFTINTPAISTTSGGGNAVYAGAEAPFKFLWGENSDTVRYNLGFPDEDSSFTLTGTNPLTTYTFPLTGAIPGINTTFTAPYHGLQVGNQLMIADLTTLPDLSNTVLKVVAVPDVDTFVVDFGTTYIDISTLFTSLVKTNLVTVSFPNHGFNSAFSITNAATPNTLQVQSLLPNAFVVGSTVWLTNSTTLPSVDGLYSVTNIIDSLTFTVHFAGEIDTPGTAFIGNSNVFYLYNALGYQDGTIGGISPNDYINNQPLLLNQIVDANSFNFAAVGTFATSVQSGGGTDVRISSYLHGFSGTQTNQVNTTTLNQPISLQGEDYLYLCSPQLDNLVDNQAGITDAFAILLLNQPPGSVIFNSFIDNPKIYYNAPLPRLESMEFLVRNPDGSLFNFNGIDYSFTLQVTEVVDIIPESNISSQRNRSYNYRALQAYLPKL